MVVFPVSRAAGTVMLDGGFVSALNTVGPVADIEDGVEPQSLGCTHQRAEPVPGFESAVGPAFAVVEACRITGVGVQVAVLVTVAAGISGGGGVRRGREGEAAKSGQSSGDQCKSFHLTFNDPDPGKGTAIPRRRPVGRHLLKP